MASFIPAGTKKFAEKREKLQKKCKDDKDIKAEWSNVYDTVNFGQYISGTKKHHIGRKAYHQLLESEAIKEELAIESELHFEYIIRPNLTLLQSLNFCNLFGHPAECRLAINEKLYRAQLDIIIDGISQKFWIKTLGKSALNKSMKSTTLDYIMRYRPTIYVHHVGGSAVIECKGVNIGVGFCNFEEKVDEGHSMIHLEPAYIEQYQFNFHAKENMNVNSISVMLHTHQKGKKTSMLLYENNMAQRAELPPALPSPSPKTPTQNYVPFATPSFDSNSQNEQKASISSECDTPRICMPVPVLPPPFPINNNIPFAQPFMDGTVPSTSHYPSTHIRSAYPLPTGYQQTRANPESVYGLRHNPMFGNRTAMTPFRQFDDNQTIYQWHPSGFNDNMSISYNMFC